MKIDLGHPVWQSLYGPYGVKDVPGVLQDLAEKWDETAAKSLFWDMLHHQDTLYPATFAALPWLLEIAEGQDKLTSDEIMTFISHVLSCARMDFGQGPQFAGSFPLTSDNCGAPVSANASFDEALQTQFAVLMAGLAGGYVQSEKDLAEACVAAAENASAEVVGYMLTGPAAVSGASHLAGALQSAPLYETCLICPDCGRAHWGFASENGYRFELIPDEVDPVGFEPKDPNNERQVAAELSKRMGLAGQSEIADYLSLFAGSTCQRATGTSCFQPVTAS